MFSRCHSGLNWPEAGLLFWDRTHLQHLAPVPGAPVVIGRRHGGRIGTKTNIATGSATLYLPPLLTDLHSLLQPRLRRRLQTHSPRPASFFPPGAVMRTAVLAVVMVMCVAGTHADVRPQRDFNLQRVRWTHTHTHTDVNVL